jgi:hypothetical protein
VSWSQEVTKSYNGLRKEGEMKKISALVTLLTLCGPAAVPKQLPPSTSIIQLIANPEKYNGQTVTVIGFMTVAFESDMLYLSYEDYEHAVVPNAIWFERNPRIMAASERLDMNYVEIIGTFTTDPVGFGLGRPGVGGIKNISSAVLRSELKHPIAEKFANAHKKH